MLLFKLLLMELLSVFPSSACVLKHIKYSFQVFKESFDIY